MDLLRIGIALTFITAPIWSQGQVPDPETSGQRIIERTENLTIKANPSLKDLEERYVKINENNQQLDGYRIQLFSSSGASSWDKANEVQSDFLKIYPDIASYVIHKKPSFKVRIGDYRTRLEAERFFIELRENFPDAFIVKDKINWPQLTIEQSDAESQKEQD